MKTVDEYIANLPAPVFPAVAPSEARVFIASCDAEKREQLAQSLSALGMDGDITIALTYDEAVDFAHAQKAQELDVDVMFVDGNLHPASTKATEVEDFKLGAQVLSFMKHRYIDVTVEPLYAYGRALTAKGVSREEHIALIPASAFLEPYYRAHTMFQRDVLMIGTAGDKRGSLRHTAQIPLTEGGNPVQLAFDLLSHASLAQEGVTA